LYKDVENYLLEGLIAGRATLNLTVDDRGRYMCISIVFLDLFFKEKWPQNVSMTSCDVTKLGIETARNWSRAQSTHGARHQELNQNIKVHMLNLQQVRW